MKSLDVGIIGCGTAGSAAALFLARAGHCVTIYERVPSPGPVGAGITIQPTGLHVLARLGIDGEIVARGARIERLLCETRSRRAVVDLAYATLGEGAFGVGLHRGVLFDALLRAVRREGNITLHTGVEVVDLDGTSRKMLVDVRGGRHGAHDLVVVADGARSQLRDDTSTSKTVTPYPWGALWFVGRDLRDASDERARVLHQVVDGNATFLGLLPTGLGPTGSDRLVSLFWSIRGDRVAEWRTRGLATWKEEVLALAPEAAFVLDQIDDVDQLLHASYHDVVMHRWTTRNVVYLGDAAHATSPQLGQGCNLALWDAMELADALAEEERDLVRALERYTRRREGHLAYYQLATRWLTPFFQGDAAWLGAVRDVAMPLMSRFPLFRRIMTLTMAGVVDGFSGRTLPLHLPG